MSEIYDVIIIGAGPAGASAAIYASRACLDVLWIDDRFIPGGQIADSALVDNYPGLPGISGADLGEAFSEHAKKLQMVPVREKVRSIEEGEGGCWIVSTKKGEYTAKTVIYAAGAAHRKLCIPGEEELEGMGVSYCATCDGAFFKDKTVVVIGGGNTACEEALFLSRICRKVYLVHRRDSLRADRILQERLASCEKVEILWNLVPAAIRGEEQVKEIVLRSTVTSEEKILETDGVFIAVGTVPNTELLKDLVTLDEAGYVAAGEDCCTSAPGIFAAGDVRTKLLRQVVTAAADGAVAVCSARKYLEEGRRDKE